MRPAHKVPAGLLLADGSVLQIGEYPAGPAGVNCYVCALGTFPT